MKNENVSRFLVIIRPEFTSFCHDACRSATFNHFLFRIAYKCKDQPKEKIQAGQVLWYASNEQIVAEMSEAWKVCKVRKEVNELIAMGLIGRTSNPAWGVDRTKHFFFGKEQCAVFVQLCEDNNVCIVHLGLPPEVVHLIYSSNANDKCIKCTCPDEGANDKSIECIQSIHPMQMIDSSLAFDKSIEAITKNTTKINNKDKHEEEESDAVASPPAHNQTVNFIASEKKEATVGEDSGHSSHDHRVLHRDGHLTGLHSDTTRHDVSPKSSVPQVDEATTTKQTGRGSNTQLGVTNGYQLSTDVHRNSTAWPYHSAVAGRAHADQDTQQITPPAYSQQSPPQEKNGRTDDTVAGLYDRDVPDDVRVRGRDLLGGSLDLPEAVPGASRPTSAQKRDRATEQRDALSVRGGRKSRNQITLHGQHILDLYQEMRGRKITQNDVNVRAANGLGDVAENDEDFRDVYRMIMDDPFLNKNNVTRDLDFMYRKYDGFLDKVERFRKFARPTPSSDTTSTRNLGGRQISSFDDPNYDMSQECYPSDAEKRAMKEATYATS